MKKILLIICAIVFAIFVSLASLRLHKSANRPLLASLLTNEIKQDVKSQTKGMSEAEIVNYAISRTAQEYKFSRKTNCMHYARLCSDIAIIPLLSTVTNPKLIQLSDMLLVGE